MIKFKKRIITLIGILTLGHILAVVFIHFTSQWDKSSHLEELSPNYLVGSVNSAKTENTLPIPEVLEKSHIENITGMKALYSLLGVTFSEEEKSLKYFFEKRFQLIYEKDNEVIYQKNIFKGVTAYISFYYLDENGAMKLKTQTRVVATSFTTKAIFLPYWYLILPASTFLRSQILDTMKNSLKTN